MDCRPDERRAFNDCDPRIPHGGHLFGRSPLAAGDDGSGMSHPPPARSCATRDEADHRFRKVFSDVFGDLRLGDHRRHKFDRAQLHEMKKTCQKHCVSTLNHNLGYCYNDARVLKWLWKQARNGFQSGARSFEG